MTKDRSGAVSTLALSTKVEEGFVSPLTSLRGALEILRDVPDLSADERARFLDTAMRGCVQLEQSVEELARTVYAAGQRVEAAVPSVGGLSPDRYRTYADRVHVLDDLDIVDIDFSSFEFTNSGIVNEFYDVIEWIIDETRRDWYFVINLEDYSVWPEAWVAFAHRGKRVNVTHSLGTVRYDGQDVERKNDRDDPNMVASRDAAFARIDEIKRAKTA